MSPVENKVFDHTNLWEGRRGRGVNQMDSKADSERGHSRRHGGRKEPEPGPARRRAPRHPWRDEHSGRSAQSVSSGRCAR